MHREISYIGAHNQLERRLTYTHEIKFIEMLSFSILLVSIENASTKIIQLRKILVSAKMRLFNELHVFNWPNEAV